MRLLLSLLLAGLATPLWAQTEDPMTETGLPRTKLEALAAQEGAVIIRGFSRIGEVRGPLGSSVVVRSQEFTNAATGEREYGLTLEVRERSRLERDHTSFVDYDEIAPLLKALEQLARLDNTLTSFNRFQADYRTHGEVQVTTYTTDASAVVAAAVTCGSLERATALLSLADLDSLRSLVDAARVEIEKKRGTAVRISSLATMRPAAAQGVPAVLRGRALEIVDDQGRVRASISVLPAGMSAKGDRYRETVLLRLITERERPSVKIGASEESAGLNLSGPTGTRNTYVILEAKDASSSLKLRNEDGREQTVKP